MGLSYVNGINCVNTSFSVKFITLDKSTTEKSRSEVHHNLTQLYGVLSWGKKVATQSKISQIRS